MTTVVPGQRHPAADWPAEQQARWVQWNFCPCGTQIGFNEPHCGEPECRRAHNTAERLLDWNGDS